MINKNSKLKCAMSERPPYLEEVILFSLVGDEVMCLKAYVSYRDRWLGYTSYNGEETHTMVCDHPLYWIPIPKKIKDYQKEIEQSSKHKSQIGSNEVVKLAMSTVFNDVHKPKIVRNGTVKEITKRVNNEEGD